LERPEAILKLRGSKIRADAAAYLKLPLDHEHKRHHPGPRDPDVASEGHKVVFAAWEPHIDEAKANGRYRSAAFEA
jgi:hypothetical protein